MSVLAIDGGTTGVTALVVSEDGRVLRRGYQEFPQHFPRPGWVEHEPEEIWQAVLAAAQAARAADGDVTASASPTSARPPCSGTARRWPPRGRAIVWQDRRTAALCDARREDGHEPRVAELTGLRLDPYFTATKLAWLAEHDER